MYGLFLDGLKVKKIVRDITDSSKYDMVVETLPPIDLQNDEYAELYLDNTNQLYYEKRKKATK